MLMNGPEVRSLGGAPPTRRRLRLLLYVPGLEAGGAERRLARLASNLDRDRFECIVGWRKPWGSVGDQLMHAAIRLRRLAFDSIADHELAVRQIRELQPDIFHSFSYLPNALDVWAAEAAGVPMIVTSRVNLREWDPDRRVQPWERDRNQRAHRVTAVSDAVARLAIEVEGLAPQQVTVLHSGVEPAAPSADPRALRRELGLADHVALIGCAANYRPEKGHGLLLQAFRDVRRRDSRCHLVCCGLDPRGRRPELLALADRLGVGDAVSLLDARDDLPSFYAGLDLYVQPSLFEGFSNALLEAMSYSLPVVATAVGGNPEAVLHDETGLLVEPNNPAALAEGLLKLLGNRERRSVLGAAAGARYRQHFSLAAMVAAYERFYDSLSPAVLVPIRRPARRDHKLRLLVHVDYLWRGGLEKRAANLVLGLDRTRFEPIVSWSRRWGEVGRRLATAGVPVVRIDPRAGHEHVAAQIAELDVDIVHSFSCTPSSDVVTGARRAGVGTILTSRTDVRFWDPAQAPTAEELDRNALTDGVLACSRAVADTCLEIEGVPAERVTVIHSGVRLPERAADGSAIRAELGLAPNDLLVGYAATYRAIKGHEILLHAFRIVVDRQPRAHLVCCGEEYDDTRLRLESLRRELHLEQHVTLLAARSEIDAVFAGLDLYVHPSLSEGFSTAILEAMTHGLPVVASAVGGTPEALLDGVTGTLVPPGNVPGLADALLDLLAHPARRARFGRAARDRVERHFTMTAMIRGHEQAYLRALGERLVSA